MDWHLLVIVLEIAACLLFLATFGRKAGRFCYLISKIPGPSLWEMLTVHGKPLLGGGLATYTCKLCASYNYKPWGMWMMNFNYAVFLSDCETISAVYKSKCTTDKPAMLFDRIRAILGDSILTMNRPHYSHRKVLGSGLRKPLQDNFLRRSPDRMSEFVGVLREKADVKDVDLRSVITWYVMTSTVIYLTSISYATTPSIFRTIIEDVPRIMEAFQMEAMNPVYYWLFVHFRTSIKQSKALCYGGLEDFDNISIDLKTQAQKNGKGEYDVAQSVILSYLSKTGDEATDEELCAIGRTLVLSGIETISFVINTILLMLALHQDVQQRVYDEIDSVWETGRPVLGEDLQRLEYTDMVIKETLRLYPAGPILLRKVKGESNFNGLQVPAGSIVMINVMALHRNPEYFPDPLKFDPNRFSSEASAGRPPYCYVPFSAGVARVNSTHL